jgi:phosphoribosylanthranilate isomerase
MQQQRKPFVGRTMGYHIRIKICGVTDPDDARMAASAGADALGLNFYAKSPRFIDVAIARAILAEIPPFVEPVGVFADERVEDILAMMRQWPRIFPVQVHGCQPMPADVRPHPLILAAAIANAADLQETSSYLQRCRTAGQSPAALLLDARVAGQFGGTGKTAPWQLLADFRPGLPIFLAGGLTAENVAEAVRLVRPYAVDVASGVESAPGRKDPDRVRRFIDNARQAAAELPNDAGNSRA